MVFAKNPTKSAPEGSKLAKFEVPWRGPKWQNITKVAGCLESHETGAKASPNLVLLGSEASKGGMKVGRIKDPLCKDCYLGISHLPSSYW